MSIAKDAMKAGFAWSAALVTGMGLADADGGMRVATSAFVPSNHAVIVSDRADGRFVATRGVVQEMTRRVRPRLAFDPKFTPAEFAAWQGKVRGKLRELMGFRDLPPAPAPKRLSAERRDGYTLERWEHYPLDGAAVPFLMLVPDGVSASSPAATVLCVPGTHLSKESLCGEPELSPLFAVKEYAEENRMALQYCRAGLVAVAVDNPGFGETSDLARAANRKNLVWRDVQTFASYLLSNGTSYMGYTSFVNHRLLEALRRDPRVDTSRLATSGHSLGAWTAGFLAVLNPDVKAAVMNQCIYSWREAAKVRTCPDADGNRPGEWGMGAFYTIPGLYTWFDIPDVFASIAPRAAFYTEGMGERDRLRVYEPAYRIAGAADGLKMQPFPDFADPKKRFNGEVPEGLRAEVDFWPYVSVTPALHYFKGRAAVPWLKAVLNRLVIKAGDGAPEAEFVAPDTVRLRANFSTNRGDRVFWRFALREDLRRTGGISFEMKCDDLAAFTEIGFYFGGDGRSGRWAYTGSCVPRKQGEWETVTIPKHAFLRNEGEAGGWGKVDWFALSPWRAGTKDVDIFIRNIRVNRIDPDVVVVRGDLSHKRHAARTGGDYVKASSRMTKFMGEMGLKVAEMAEGELDERALSGVKLVVFPWTPELPAESLKAVRTYIANGGRILACYDFPGERGDLLGLEGRFFPPPRQPYLTGIVRNGAGLAGQPEKTGQASWCCTKATLKGPGEVLAWWQGPDRKPLDIPALVKVPSGYFFAHGWQGDASGMRELMRAICLDVCPAWRTQLDAAEKARTEAAAAERAWVLSQPSVAGETRGISTHFAEGPQGYTWDEAAEAVKRAGFQKLTGNVAWGWGTGIFHKEAREMLAACRKHGLQSSFWMVMWQPRWDYRGPKAAHMQRDFAGKELNWLCPSDPSNRTLQVEMALELAHMGPDIVSLDYIRYPGPEACFCPLCRAAFEARLGRAVANWPADVRKDAALAAEWKKFRCDNITRTVREISHRMRRECPKVKLAGSFFQFVEGPAEHQGQDWVAWCHEGLFDIAGMMLYVSADSPYAYEAILRQEIEAVKGSGVNLVPTIGLETWPDPAHDARRLCEQVSVIRAQGLKAYNVFQFCDRLLKIAPDLKKGVFAK